MQSDNMDKLIHAFRTLPGVGAKTAQRYAYSIIENSDENAANFANAILEAKKAIKFCKICGNYTENDICDICTTRSQKTICVVSQPKDIEAFEKMGSYNGSYHVLHGVIDFSNGIGPDKIRVKELISRLAAGVEEVIIATNADVCGEVTSTYLANTIKPLGIKVTRLAYGMSVGSEIEYADEVTLKRALDDRKSI